MATTQYQRFDEAERGMKKNDKIKTICGSFFVGAISATLIFWGISELAKKDQASSAAAACDSSYIVEPTTEQSDALSDIHDVFANTTWMSTPLSDMDQDRVRDAFDAFDEDGDGEWCYDEFVTYKSFLSNHSSLFYTIDVDNDTIVSNRELVAYFLNVGGVSKYILVQKLQNRVLYTYGLDERNASSKSQRFHEYVADIIFQNFDSYGKGYFNLTDFQYMFYNRSWTYFDRNDDDMVSFDEFIESQYHQSNIGNPSGAFMLFRNTIRGNQTYQTQDGETRTAKIYSVRDYDHHDVAQLNLTVCPTTEYSAITDTVMNRRRLSCLWDSLDCAMNGVESAASCSTAIAADGVAIPDDLECGGKLIEMGSSCYDAWDDCFGSDSSSGSSGSSGSYSNYGDSGYYGSSYSSYGGSSGYSSSYYGGSYYY